MIKEGDILICIKKKKRFFINDSEPMFTNNKKYEVKSIILGSVSGLPFISLFIYDDFGVRRFLDSDLKSESLSKILFSVKQIRKQKLDKIKKL